MTIDYADTQAIRDLLDQYFQAVGRADIDALRKMSLPESSMYGLVGKQMLAGSPEPFFTDLSGRPSMVEQGIDCAYVVKNIQVAGCIATAATLVDNFYGTMSIENFFCFMKVDSRWRITSNTFTSL